MNDRSMLCWDSHQRAGKNLGWLGSARRDALCDERRRLNLASRLGAQIFVAGGEKACRSNHAAKGRSRACIEGKKLICHCCRRYSSLAAWLDRGPIAPSPFAHTPRPTAKCGSVAMSADAMPD